MSEMEAEGGHQHPDRHLFQNSQHVYFNDGDNANVYALILKTLSDGNLNLHCIPESGQPFIVTDIPRREPGDYDDDGGGDTWHVNYWAAAEIAPD
jgi:hypothetical protein